MNFVLRYRGPLLAGGKGRQKDKQRIREYFHPQLKELCKREVLLSGALRPDLKAATLKGGCIIPWRNKEGNLEKPLFWRVSLGQYEFVPLVTRPHELVSELDIIWLRNQKPGAIVHGGHLDNRLKSLLDGLRMPHSVNELPKPDTDDSSKERRLVYCLLEDDALIQRIGITTHQLLEPQIDDTADDVELLLNVAVKSTLPMLANLGFPT